MTDIHFLAWAIFIGLVVAGALIATAINGLADRFRQVNVNMSGKTHVEFGESPAEGTSNNG